MASKLHKAGSIFARMDGLVTSGVKKMENRPMWYDIYKAFPPKYEPNINTPLPDTPIKAIFYKEDIARAKLHKNIFANKVWNLRVTKEDQDIQLYLKKLEEGLTDDEAYKYVEAQIKERHTVETKVETVSPQVITENISEVPVGEDSKL